MAAIIPNHFRRGRFWILDFRLPEKVGNRIGNILVMFFVSLSAIQNLNRKSKMLLDHPIRPRQHIGRNRLTILDFRFWILDWSIIGLLDLLWPIRSGVLLIRSVLPSLD
jgi:hypothetical protein